MRYLPGSHATHDVSLDAPNVAEYEPAVQFLHVEIFHAASWSLQVPAVQLVHFLLFLRTAFACQPWGHFSHFSLSPLYAHHPAEDVTADGEWF